MALVHLQPDGEPICAGLGLPVEPGTGTTVPDDVTCQGCRVMSDKLVEEGDLLLVGDDLKSARFQFDERPPEFRTTLAFAAFLNDNERTTFAVEELQELVANTKERYLATLLELRRMGFSVERHPEPKWVRGINSYWK